MTRHLLRLIWHRKGSNLLVMTEILLSFLVLFGVVTLGIFYSSNFRHPLGFDYENVWCLEVGRPGDWSTETEATMNQLVRALGELQPVQAAAPAFAGPFASGSWTSVYTVGGRSYDYAQNVVGDGFRETMGLELLEGRWFGREDDGAVVRPVVINDRMAHMVFGGDESVGKLVPQDKDRNDEPRPEMRVIGVVRDFRQHGEFSTPESYVFQRLAGSVVGVSVAPPRLVVIKVRPGTPAAFEEALMTRALATAPDWSFTVKPAAEVRATNHRLYLAPLIVVGLVSGFLLLMVALGLTGVLWQSVTQRTREIGLRRAKGASIPRIHAQFLGEILVMTTLSLSVGVLVAAQLLLFDEVTGIEPGVYFTSLAISILAIYCLTAACGYYPSRLATRVTPAEALRYE
jgi:putative ABC transport system permease protein